MGPASTPGAGERDDVVARVAGRVSARYPVLSQLARYVVVGGAATGLNAALFLLLRQGLETFTANLVALTLTTAVSTEANRRFAFGGARAHRLREWVQDIGTVTFYAGYTSVVLVSLHGLLPGATPAQEATAVAVASVAGGLLRFTVLRLWVFETRRGPHGPRGEDTSPCSRSSPRST